MRTFYIKKRASGEFMYTQSLYTAWNNFPDDVKNQQQIASFFMRGGYDEPELKFVDASGRPMTNYSIREEKNGWIHADINGDSGAIFVDLDFMPAKAQAEFLKELADSNIVKKAESLQSDVERLKHYKLYAEASDFEKLQNKIKELKTPEKITELCEQHAKRYYNSPANVEFVK